MKIAVLLKIFRGEINLFDGAALECALEWGAEVTVVSMAPTSALPVLENLTRLGVRAVLISDPLYAGSDTQATSCVLAEALRQLSPDLVFAGRQSIDGDTGQVPPMLAERLGIDIISGVMEFNQGALKTRSGRCASPKSSAIITFERIRTLRFPSIFSKEGSVEVWDNSTLGLDPKKCGAVGSPTKVVRSYESSVGKRSCRFASVSELGKLIKDGLEKKRESVIADDLKKTEKIYYIGDVKDIAERYAESAVRFEAHGKTPDEVADELKALGAEVVLFESCDEYRELAARVAVICGAGICADCISFRREGEKFIMTRPALGGNVTADIVSSSNMSFATVRNAKSAEGDIIFSVGRGAIGYIEEIRALAEKYGATLAGSRVLTDNGMMPYKDQVGLTGKTVSPKVYVAFGISGAVQHTSAISGAGTVIAINTDKNARIFDYSDYGIVEDIKNLFEEK